MERKLYLQKYLVILFISLIAASPAYAQKPTIEDNKWTEETFDEAYTAPTSLIAKTWRDSGGFVYAFRADKTFSLVLSGTFEEYGIEWKITVPGTWKRDKTNLSFTSNFAKGTFTYDKAALAKLPLRRQELAKKAFANQTNELRASNPTTDHYQILRLEKDILVLGTTASAYCRGGYEPKVLSPVEK